VAARSAGKNHAFCRPPNEGTRLCPLKAPQATFERRCHAEWPRSAGKNHAFCRPPNEAHACPLKAPQATFSLFKQ
jgi:hypothetical protein